MSQGPATRTRSGRCPIPALLGRIGPLLLAWLFAPHAVALDDYQSWNSFGGFYHAGDRLRLGARAEVRLDQDLSHGWFFLASHLLRYRVGERLDTEANLSYVRLRLQGAAALDLLRLELGVIPRWRLGPRLDFVWRNRLELWVREGALDEEIRLRVFPRWNLALGESDRARLFFGNEFLLHDSPGQFFQNRLFPIGATLAIGAGTQVDLYLMLVSLRTAEGWRHAAVLGQSWRF
jgi:hypothetical protein